MSWNIYTDEEEDSPSPGTNVQNLLPLSLREVWDDNPLHHPNSMNIVHPMNIPRSPTPNQYVYNQSFNQVNFGKQPGSFGMGQPTQPNVSIPSSAPTMNFPMNSIMSTPISPTPQISGQVPLQSTESLFNPNDVSFQGKIKQDGKTLTSNYYQVQFTPFRTAVFNAPRKLTIKVGDYVLTEADRGYDVGRVVGNIQKPSHNEMKNLKLIVRLASQYEISQLPLKAEREAKALALCQQKVAEMELPMRVTAAEFQFDGKKLTFYYTASSYVDFRMLVKNLFRIFSTRIWMFCTNDNNNNINRNSGMQ